MTDLDSYFPLHLIYEKKADRTTAMQHPDTHTIKTKPPSSIKLFVGQVPKSMDENELVPIFSPYGNIFELSIIRHKATGLHRGCAFVTYTTKEEADCAIEHLHNQKTLPPLTHPLQVKYADEELKKTDPSEHKLFLGMIPKTATEEQLRKVFEPFGPMQEITILRGPDGVSKGCGFVRYEHREDAVAAINACNGQVFLDGSTQSLVVKFADQKKEAVKKDQETMLLQLKNQQLEMIIQQLAWGQQYNQLGMLGGAPALIPALQQPQVAAIPQLQSALQAQLQPQLQAQQLQQMQDPVSPTWGGLGGVVPTMGSNPQVKGPPDANLFIYHLPQQYGDQDLLNIFSPFGNVLSAKVFIDKNTGQSKCFGFVSYDKKEAAMLAIQHMNGFQICQKRLKVELKRGSHPY